MIRTDSVKCNICGADFRPEAMKDGKCEQCNKLFPNANSLKEIRDKKNPDKVNEGNLHRVVIEKVYDILDNLGILSECSCGKKYYKKSPAQKKCGECPEKKETK